MPTPLIQDNHIELDASRGPDSAGLTMPDGLSIELIGPESRSTVLSEWKELQDRVEGASLFATAEWTDAWLRQFGDLIPFCFVLGRHRDQLRGICLLCDGVNQTTGPMHVNSLHVGTAGEPDEESVCIEYNQILCEPNYQKNFMAGLHQVVDNDESWEEFRLDGFWIRDIEPMLTSDQEFHITAQESHFFNLKQTRDNSHDVISRFGHSTRKKIRRNLRNYGALKLEWAETVEQAESIYDELVKLHQARWNAAGNPGSYSQIRFRDFHRDLIRILLPQKSVVLARITQAGNTIGCLHNYVDRNRTLAYQSGFHDINGSDSPGLICDYLLIEEALRRGYDAYDFLSGSSFHKTRMSTDVQTLVWAQRRRRSLKYAALDTLRTIKQLIKELAAS